MPLETGTSINDLVSTNPAAGDNVSEGDDHLRLLKTVIKASFPNMNGAFWREQVKSATYTATAGDNFTHFVFTSSAPLLLPPAATAGNGFSVLVFPQAAATTVTIEPDGAETVNSSASASVQYGTLGLLTCTGSVWYLHKMPRFVDDGVYLPGTATISGTTVIGGNLYVAGATTLSGTVVIGNNIQAGGSLSLSGQATLNTGLYVRGPTTLSGTVILGGPLTVGGVASISGAVVTSNFQVQGSSTLVGSVVMNNALQVQGTTTLSGTTVVVGNLYVAGSGGITVSAGVLCASIELVGAAIGSASYIDFKNNLVDDTDVRIVLTGDNALDIQGLDTDGLTKDGAAIYHRGNVLGTASQSGGTPTGALIEVGSNASGTYARYAGNIQICNRTVAVGQYSPTSHGHAAVFTTTPTLVITIDASLSMFCSSVNVGVGTFEIQPGLTHDGVTLTSTANATMRVIAIGPWF